jgi:hypothetical protein
MAQSAARPTAITALLNSLASLSCFVAAYTVTQVMIIRKISLDECSKPSMGQTALRKAFLPIVDASYVRTHAHAYQATR